MATFAHVETLRVIDPIVVADEAAYRALFSVQAAAGWNIKRVADGTAPGTPVTLDESGNITGYGAAPAVHARAPQPKGYSGTDFITFCGQVLAQLHSTSFIDGVVRLDAIIRAMLGSESTMMGLAKSLWQAALSPNGAFTKDQATLFFGYLVSNGDPNTLTSDESAAILAAWEMV